MILDLMEDALSDAIEASRKLLTICRNQAELLEMHGIVSKGYFENKMKELDDIKHDVDLAENVCKN